MKYWLMKCEPDVFSIADLERTGKTSWEGVRNYQARNHLRDMQVGDLALYYHSNSDPSGVAGVCRISKSAYADPAQFDKQSDYYDAGSKKEDPRWSMVDVEFVEKLATFVPLEQLKEEAALSGMLVIKRGMRLSVQPVERADFSHVLKMGKSRTKLPR